MISGLQRVAADAAAAPAAVGSCATSEEAACGDDSVRLYDAWAVDHDFEYEAPALTKPERDMVDCFDRLWNVSSLVVGAGLTTPQPDTAALAQVPISAFLAAVAGSTARSSSADANEQRPEPDDKRVHGTPRRW